jgi:hypothetical protein
MIFSRLWWFGQNNLEAFGIGSSSFLLFDISPFGFMIHWRGVHAMNATFKTDGDGNIITNPVTGWTTALVANSAVILAIEFLELKSNSNEAQTAYGSSIQFVLTPPQCQELSEILARAATAAMPKPADSKTPLN